MEKQKVFWVVLSVSVFVVVVLLVGVLLLRQHPASAPRAAVSPMTDAGTQVYEYQREAPRTPSGSTSPAGSPSPGDQQTMHFYIGEGGAQASQTPGAATPPTGAASPSGTSPASGAAAPGVQSPPASTSPAHPQVGASSRARSTKPSVQARTPRKTADYWIQAGSYKSQGKAEELVALLDGKGLGSRVFSYASKGDTYYRVRVGPYSNKGEADKFLALVKQVQGLEASYVSMVPPSRRS
jgi:cell division protein FtsN